jgi:hypothetical protein
MDYSKGEDRLNRELFEKVKAKILAVPDQFDMGDWESAKDCGTTRCIAGWALYLSGNGYELHQENTYEIQMAAAKVLEINEEQAGALFFRMKWPKEFRDASVKTTSEKKGAEIACRRIDHFMETNE